jgi:hypothetical protein
MERHYDQTEDIWYILAGIKNLIHKLFRYGINIKL